MPTTTLFSSLLLYVINELHQDMRVHTGSLAEADFSVALACMGRNGPGEISPHVIR